MIWLGLISTGIVALFWYNEWVYSLPTPLPADYRAVKLGEKINIDWHAAPDDMKPVFLHFFNPDCPCSRFNIPHFKSLAKKYGDDVTFAVVPMIMLGQKYSTKEIQDKFGMDIIVLSDPTIAISCGVYSTPQAVIVDVDHKLYYRGNYNKSRYCTDKKSNYAEMALESLLLKTPDPVFSPLAIKAYGCQIPSCTK